MEVYGGICPLCGREFINCICDLNVAELVVKKEDEDKTKEEEEEDID